VPRRTAANRSAHRRSVRQRATDAPSRTLAPCDRAPLARPPRAASTCSRLIAATLAAAGLSAGETVAVTVHGPNLRLERIDGRLIGWFDQGFVARSEQHQVMGDAALWDEVGKSVYVMGNVVLANEQMRLRADRLGFGFASEAGEAWQVDAVVQTPKGDLPIVADKLTFDRDALVFEGVRSSARHGGFLGVSARRIRVELRDKPALDREGPARQAEGVAVVGPTVRVIGVPLLWVPYLYRDFRLDYPWTRFEYGRSDRLGNYVRGWIGSGLPEVAGVRSSVYGRVDHYTTAGTGFGAGSAWRLSWLGNRIGGSGRFDWFAIKPESIANVDGVVIEERDQRVIDAEQQVRVPGGAIYGRWIETPGPDASSIGGVPDERFRADYLRGDLSGRPLARRGLTAAWGVPAVTVVLDTERRSNAELPTTERLWGAQAVLPDTALAGPLHLRSDLWAERLDEPLAATSATRMTGSATLAAVRWSGGFAADASAGMRGLGYSDGEIAGTAIDDESRSVATADAGLRLRFTGRFGDLLHIVTPRVGVQAITDGYGDDLTVYGFGDSREILDEDKRFLVTGLTTSVGRSRALFQAALTARWALRQRDRAFADLDGTVSEGDSTLYDVAFTATGAPWPGLSGLADVLYDFEAEAFRRLDTSLSWSVHPRVVLSAATGLVGGPLLDDREIQYRPGIRLIGDRYRLDATLTFFAGGADVDGWSFELSRSMVDGRLELHYDLVRDAEGAIFDRRVSVTFQVP